MSGNSFGKLFTVTTFGESHGPAIGCVVDGCPPGLPLTEADIQPELDRRKPGTSPRTGPKSRDAPRGHARERFTVRSRRSRARRRQVTA